MSASSFSNQANGQPSPEMEKKWESVVIPKIQKNLKAQLKTHQIKSMGHTTLWVRGYLEKNGLLKHLYIDRKEAKSDLPKAELVRLERTLISAIAHSAPLPYLSVAESRLSHLGLVVIYQTQPEKLEAGITQPEDHLGP